MKTKLALLIVLVFILSVASPLLYAAPNGPWVDEVVFFKEQDPAKVVDMISKGDMHLYFIDVGDPQIFQKVKEDPNVNYKFAYGLYYELTFNPVGPEFRNGEFNPFSNPRIREAMNYIIDRNYIVEEIMGGLAKPKFLPLVSAFPDYARLIDIIKILEARYSYNFEKGKEIIFEEMAKMGAEFREGKWYYKDKPVVIKFLIRIEDQRKEIGDYVANQLEKLGFTVERLYKSSREASPIWLFGNPADGQWHIYTGGWITTAVSRDDADNFAFFYTPLGIPLPLWQAYKPDPIFYEVARKLWNRDFKTFEERQELMAKACELALKDSVRVWLVDQLAPFLLRADIDVAADLSGGFSTAMWPRTIRFKDREGGTIKAGNREVLVDPWNPVAGTDWVYDTVIQYATNEYALLSNPYTGLPMANRIVSAEVYALKDVRTTKSSDWLKLEFVDKVEVPADAWYAYDATNDKVVTAGEAGVKAAEVKVVVNYGNVIGKFKFHDGTTMTLADWLIGWALTFARADPNSPLYDEASVAPFEEWRQQWIAEKIVSEDPLIIEYYINYTHPEAEFIVSFAAGFPSIPAHALAIGIKAEEKGLLAFSADKADAMKVEWMNYIGGPSLEVLSNMLDEALAEGYIPFKGFLGKFITVDEMKARYQALKNWYNEHGHFWVADGPFYLDKVDFNAHQAILKAWREHPDPADKWAFLASPPIPEVAVEAPENVVPGLDAEFTIKVTYKGKPYANNRIEFVKYLLLDSAGNVLAKGDAEAAGEGVWKVKFSSDETGKLTPGTYKLLAIVLSKDVAMPGQAEQPFTVIPQIAYFQTLIAGVQSNVEAKIGSLESGISSLNTKVSELESSIAAVQSGVNTAMIVGIVGIILAIVAIVLALRKPKTSKE